MRRFLSFFLANSLIWPISSLLFAAASNPDEQMEVLGQHASLSDRLGLSQIVITRAAIEATHAPSLIDVLAQIPGFQLVQTGSRGSDSSLFIRGANTSHFIVAIDGVPQRDPTLIAGGMLLSHLNTADVERIEIFKGPQSLIYGSDGLAGLINIVSRQHPGGSLSLEAGNRQYQRAEAYLQRPLSESFTLKLLAGQLKEQGESDANQDRGNRELDPYARQSLDATLAYSQGPWSGKVSLDRQRQSKDLDSFGSEGFSDDPNYCVRSAEDHVTAEINRSLGDHLLGVSYSQMRMIRDYENAEDAVHPSASRSEYMGIQEFVDLRSRWNWEHQLTLVGVQFTQETAEFDDDFDGFSSSLDKRSQSTGLYATHRWQLSPTTEVSIGLRRDAFARYGSSDTYNLYAAHDFGLAHIYSNFGRAFKAPSLYQRFSTYGLETLKAERSQGFEFGVKSKDDQLFIAEFSAFENRYLDLIDYSMSTQTYDNISGDTTIKGLEGRIGMILARQSLSLDTAHLTFETQSGTGLPRRPSQTYGLHYRWTTEDWSLGLDAQRIGERYDQGSRLKPYQVLNSSGERSLGAYRLYYRIDNLLATRYEQAVGYGGHQRRWLGGVKWAF